MSQWDILDALEHAQQSESMPDSLTVQDLQHHTERVTGWDAPRASLYRGLAKLYEYDYITIEYHYASQDNRVVERYKANTNTSEEEETI